jgi:hemerythrin-like domain-containing protein
MHGTKASGKDWPHEPVQQAATLTAFFERHLRQHFRIEEEIVFPAAHGIGSEAETLVAQLLDEHRQMVDLVEQLAANPQVTAAELAAFGQLLNDHIRLEDRQLFPLMEAQMSADALLDLQQRVESSYSA